MYTYSYFNIQIQKYLFLNNLDRQNANVKGNFQILRIIFRENETNK